MFSDSISATAVRTAYLKGYRVVAGKVFNRKGKKRKLGIMPGTTPYYRFNIGILGKRFPVRVHQLLAFQKFGEALFDDKVHVRHLDDDSLNNLDDNIALGTATQNMLDTPARLRRDKASKSRQYTAKFIISLQGEHAGGTSYKQLRKKYGVPSATLSYYLSRSAKRTTFAFPLSIPAVLVQSASKFASRFP